MPAAAALAYFGYHAVYGEVGYTAWMKMRAETARLDAELRAVRTRNAELEAAIAGLRPESLDPDAVETALRRLGYVDPGERVIIERAD
ncbi:MAG: FtsB family cell division protein [Alphaproteobacteria bacterium]